MRRSELSRKVCDWFAMELQSYCGNLLWQSCLTLLFRPSLEAVGRALERRYAGAKIQQR